MRLFLLQELEIDLRAEDLGVFGTLIFDEFVVHRLQGGYRYRVNQVLLTEGVQDGGAVGADRLFAKAESVAGDRVNRDFAGSGERLPEEELLLIQRILGAKHGQAGLGRTNDGNFVQPLQALNEGLKRRERCIRDDLVKPV
jgi:hypothetical protein